MKHWLRSAWTLSMASRIRTDIPLPPTTGRGKRSGVSASMRALHAAPVGASLFFPNAKPAALYQAANKVGSGWYTMRKEDEDGVPGYRVWNKGAS